MKTTQTEIRRGFWASHPEFKMQSKPIPYTQKGRRLYRFKTQNEYRADVRCAFVDFVDSLARSGDISEKLAAEVTL